MNTYLSLKLKFLSFLLIIFVVYLHSYNLVFATSSTISENILFQEFISQGLTRVAVPLFFIISAYLFFINFDGTKQLYKLKIKKRIKTLLIPYVFWSVLGIITFFCFQLFPLSATFFSKEPIRDYTIAKLIETILINPIPFQLWFIRDLMILTLVTPLFYFVIKNLKALILFPFFTVWLFNVNLYFISNEALLFFMVGAYFGMNPNEMKSTTKLNRISILLLILWLGILVFKTLLAYCVGNSLLINLLHKSGILIGIIAIWSFYDIIFYKRNIEQIMLFPLIQFTFFIYAFHYPLIGILQKVFIYLFGKEESVLLVIYLVTPLIVILVSIILAWLLKNKTLKLYSIITGNR